LQPTGSKDPFALRRQANGIVKTVAEHKLPLSLRHLWTDALTGYQGSEAEKAFSATAGLDDALAGFFRERLEHYLRDVLGLEYDTVNAVLAAGFDDVVDAVARAQAVSQVRRSEDFQHIAIAFKRISNILRQAYAAGVAEPGGIGFDAQPVDESLFADPAEKALAQAAQPTATAVAALRQKKNYEEALRQIASLRPAIDSFFDKVMVMADDEKIRANRLAQLAFLENEFSTIADFSEIVTEGKGS